jgi:hypothetical protein
MDPAIECKQTGLDAALLGRVFWENDPRKNGG